MKLARKMVVERGEEIYVYIYIKREREEGIEANGPFGGR